MAMLNKFKGAAKQVQEEVSKQRAPLKGAAFMEAVRKAQEMESKNAPRIKVCVRVRCFIKEEIEGGRSGGTCELCIEMPSKTAVIIQPPRSSGQEPKQFDFDRVYWSFSEDHPLYANQQTLQDELGAEMIQQALMGFNNCIFAYGQTGSGKSYSVLGGKGEQRGLLPRVTEGIFEQFAELGADVTCKTQVAFLEVYNEQIRDLLAAKDDKAQKLEVKQHPVLGTFIPGLTEAAVGSCEEVFKLIDYGTQMRCVSATAMNSASSRSHCIFTFKTSISDNVGTATMSQTHLVDLAGSERAGRTQATGQRLKEGAAINQSLSALSRVISELSKKKKGNPPFRDSKLTYILKESLSGNSKTIMMAALSPNSADYEETLSTLQFAKSVKMVQTKVVANQVNEKGVEAQLRREIEELKAQLQTASDVHDDDRSAQVQKRLAEQEEVCKYWGKDWETVLSEQRAKMAARMSVVGPPPVVTESGDASPSPKNRSKSQAKDDEDDDDNDNDSDVSEAEAKAQCALVYMSHDPSEPSVGGARNSIRIRLPDVLALTGPAAMEVMKAKPDEMTKRARDRTKDLHKLIAETERAQVLVRELTESGKSSLRLRVATAASMDWEEDFGDGPVLVDPLVDILVIATYKGCQEWMSSADFRKRLSWLEEQIDTFEDAWAEALAEVKLRTLAPTPTSTPTSPAAAAAGGSEALQKELEALKKAHEATLLELEAARKKEAEEQARTKAALDVLEQRMKVEHEASIAELKHILLKEREEEIGALKAAHSQQLVELNSKNDKASKNLHAQVDAAEKRAEDAEYHVHVSQARLLSLGETVEGSMGIEPYSPDDNANFMGNLAESFERALKAISASQSVVEEVSQDLKRKAASLPPAAPAAAPA